jgi:hypothetical protein
MAFFGNICLRARSGDGLTVPFAPPGWQHPAVVLFFVTVNQVLVRLWARVSELVCVGVSVFSF